MTFLSDSIRKSNINLQNISNSLSGAQKSVSSVNDSVDKVSKTITTNSKIKKDLFSRASILQSRRIEASRRQEIEDQIESSKVSTIPSKGLSFASKSEQGPFGRLLGFLSFLTAGWIVENLPTWIFMGQEFVSRAYKFGNSLTNMLKNVQNISSVFGDTLKNTLTSVIRLDFDLEDGDNDGDLGVLLPNCAGF